MRYKLIFLCCFLNVLTLKAQQQPQHEKGTYTDEQNRYYQHPSLPLYLYLSHSAEGGNPTPLRNAKDNQSAPLYLDGHGVHYLRHPITRGKNSGGEIKYTIYADGIAPVSYTKLLNAPSRVRGGKIYYGKQLSAAITAKDEMSGTKESFFSINQSDYKAYQSEISFVGEGEVLYKLYSLDNVGNAEKPQEYRFTVDLTPPTSQYALRGDQQAQTISPRTILSLSAADSLVGVNKILYNVDNNEPNKIYKGALNFSFFEDGEHTIYFKSIDHVKNEEETQRFSFYLDKTPPSVTSEVLGDRFIAGGKTYFAGRTKLKLNAFDNKSGVKAIYYSIDGADYQPYTEPFYIPNKRGDHLVNFYAIDYVNNKGSGSYQKSVSSMYMDLTGPTLSRSFSGNTYLSRDTVFVNDKTKILLNAKDIEAGVQYITFKNGKGEEQSYQQGFTLAEEGVQEIEYFGYDNVNNMNRGRFVVKVDKSGPEIFTHFSALPLERRILAGAAAPSSTGSNTSNGALVEVYVRHVALFVAATDGQIGADKIFYSINNGGEMPYSVPIQNFLPNKLYRIKIRAIDKLGNQTIKELTFQTAK